MKFPLERRNLLITGVGGFIGSHFLEWFLENTAWTIAGIDSFLHKGTYSRLDDIKNIDNDRFRVFHHDLSAPIDDALALKISNWIASHSDRRGIDYVVNLASNSAVERSISDPSECWRNNCNLILNTLEYARVNLEKSVKFIHISTDEVYGDYSDQDGNGSGHKEWSTILPSNPYAASKAAQEALCAAYWRTYKIPIVIVNTMNNIGERQDNEKFLPKIISSIALRKEIPVYVDSNDVPGSRVYLDAKVHAAAILHILSQTISMPWKSHIPDRYNVCGYDEIDNREMVLKIASIMGVEPKIKLVKADSLRPGYDKRYLLDGSKLESTGFTPEYSIDQTLERIVRHCLKNQHWLGKFPVETAQHGEAT